MRAFSIPLVVAAMLGAAACQREAPSAWFKGDYQAARTAAAERDTVLMIQFYTDWCNWCRRLEADTFSVPAVRDQLAKIVSLRVNAEEAGEELARRFDVDSYPTMIFLDSDGQEMDRILGYLPPDKFLIRV
jgi:thioredoxin-related protein